MRNASRIGVVVVAASIAVGVVVVGCGGPVLQNAPKPDPAVVAGAAAAIAGAATLADPNGQAKRVEANKPVNDTKPVRVKENVPAGVFDRLDDKRTHDGGSGSGSGSDGAGSAPAHDPADGEPFDQPAQTVAPPPPPAKKHK